MPSVAVMCSVAGGTHDASDTTPARATGGAPRLHQAARTLSVVRTDGADGLDLVHAYEVQ
jgi:hypothetical protein